MRHVSTNSDTPFTPQDWADALFAGPGYEPTAPGALQDELAWNLVKYLRDDALLTSEVEVEVEVGPGADAGPAFFTIDLLVELPTPAGSRRVAFEVGGSRSPRDHQRRLGRDATLLARGGADTVYRLRSADLWHHMEDVLYLASRWDTDLFSERGHVNLRTLASPQARALAVSADQPTLRLDYAEAPALLNESPESALWHAANGSTPHIALRRLDRRHPQTWREFAASPLRHIETAPLRRAS